MAYAKKQQNRHYDVVLLNGNVIDPSSETIEEKNIGIVSNQIAIVTNDRITGDRTIDARGKMVAPGFIDFHSHVDGNPFAAKCIARQGGTTTIGGERFFDGKVTKRIEEEGFLINQGFLISHSFSLRKAAGITDPYKAASKHEIETMVYLANEFLERGAFGVHFGLEFFPGTSFDEIHAMAKVVKKYNRIMPIHLRKDGREALKYFDEVINAMRLTGVSVQIIQLMYMVGIAGAMKEALDIIENARDQGYDIVADSGLYDAFSACIGTSIFDPGWQLEYGRCGTKDLLINSGIYSGQHCDDALFEYLRREFPNTLVTAFVCDTEDILTAIRKPYVYVSTNAADGPYYPEMGHPEVSGTFPRLIGKYVREMKALTLMEAIQKITLLPAKRYGIANKGWIGVGADADLVVFDFNKIIDKSDYLGKGDPDAAPEGIEYVLVNGSLIVDKGILDESSHHGKLIRHVNTQ